MISASADVKPLKAQSSRRKNLVFGEGYGRKGQHVVNEMRDYSGKQADMFEEQTESETYTNKDKAINAGFQVIGANVSMKYDKKDRRYPETEDWLQSCAKQDLFADGGAKRIEQNMRKSGIDLAYHIADKRLCFVQVFDLHQAENDKKGNHSGSRSPKCLNVVRHSGCQSVGKRRFMKKVNNQKTDKTHAEQGQQAEVKQGFTGNLQIGRLRSVKIRKAFSSFYL